MPDDALSPAADEFLDEVVQDELDRELVHLVWEGCSETEILEKLLSRLGGGKRGARD